MAMRLTIENVRICEEQILDETDVWEEDKERASMLLAYIAGVRDMSAAVKKAIVKLGGN